MTTAVRTGNTEQVVAGLPNGSQRMAQLSVPARIAMASSRAVLKISNAGSLAGCFQTEDFEAV